MMETLYQLAAEPPEYKILTNDADRVMCALQWVNDNDIMDKVLLFDVNQKSTVIATECIEFGNRAFSYYSFIETYKIYTIAALYALPNSKELARAYANRSAVAFEMTMYAFSLKDIERALAIGYPDNLKGKLYVRQVKCLWAVHQKMCPEIKSSIAKAEEWIKKANEPDRNKLQKALNNINIPMGVDLLSPNTSLSAHFMSATSTDNLRILRASESIELKYSQEFGRHLAAVQDISAGQVLFCDKTFASVPAFKPQSREFILDTCWNCSKICFSSITCTQCVNVNYCNEECRDNDWNNYHEIDCPIISQLVSGSAEPNLFLALRMAMKALQEAGSFQELQSKICKIDSITDPVEKLLEGNVFDSSKYASVYSLATEYLASFDHAVRVAIVLMMLCRTAKIFGSAMKDVKDIIDHKWTAFMGSLILRNLQIVDAVGYKQMLVRADDDTITDCVAHAIQPLIALCNHSCDANTGIYFYHNIFVVIALQKISTGQQIVVSYDDKVDFQEFSKIVRRKRLQGEYKFFCTCTACTNDWKISNMKAYKRLLSGKKVEKLQILIHKLYGLQMTSRKARVSEQITLLEDILNTFNETTQGSCVEFFHFKSMLNNLCRMESI